MEYLGTVFGEGSELTPVQMAARAAVIFVVTIVLIRISGRRSFGQGSPFDACIAVLMGAVLSRAVVGASPFLATVAAATILVLMHRLVAWLSLRSPWFDRLISGQERLLVSEGRKQVRAMAKALVSDRDLAEAMRKKFGVSDLSRVQTAVLERDGEISVLVARDR